MRHREIKREEMGDIYKYMMTRERKNEGWR